MTLRSKHLIRLWHEYFHEGRGGRFKLAVVAGLGVRGVLLPLSLVSLPITIDYLGVEGYGLMLTVSSAIGWIQIASLGIAPALQNALTREIAQSHHAERKELISTAYVALAAVISVLAVIGALCIPSIEWTQVFPPSTDRFLYELRLTVGIVFSCFCANIILSLFSTILAARGENHTAQLAALLSGIVTFTLLVLAVTWDWGLAGVAFANAGSAAIVGTAFTIWLFIFRSQGELRPRWSAFSRRRLKALIGASMHFAVLGFSNIAFYQSEALILIHFVGADSVTPYGVAQRIYAQLMSVIGVFTGNLWIAYGYAKAQGDTDWILRVYFRVRRVQGIAMTFILVFMLVAGEPLLQWWVGHAAAPDVPLIAVLGAAFIVQQWTATHAMMLNGIDVVRGQIPCLLTNGALVVLFGVAGAWAFGAIGLAAGTLIAYTITSVWYLPRLFRHSLGKLKGEAR